MTFADLRALHAIIGDALDNIQHCYATAGDLGPQASSKYASPPPSPSVSVPPTIPPKPTFLMSSPTARSAGPSSLPPPAIDFPSLNSSYDPSSPAEILTTNPTVVAAINRIVAACGQIAMGVQSPFLSLCDAVMGYHLPSCMRLLETTHTVEILRDAGSTGLHVDRIAEMNGMDAGKLGHILRLLATHHITREVAPDVFANNRVSGCMDSGKAWRQLVRSPETKYEDTNGISAFVGLCTDELFKSSAFLTEAYYLDASTKYSREPTHAPFNFAFETTRGFFGWLEDDGTEDGGSGGKLNGKVKGNKHRLERFGKAMAGTGSWEAPGAILTGFDWSSLAPGNTVVDVGGGIGSTSMVLALAGECEELKFVVQDREVVVAMGEKAWHSRYPELLNSGRVEFQVHDFFTPQPIKDASVFLLRVILHDWPDAFARRILMRLREAAREPGWRVRKGGFVESSPEGEGVIGDEDGGNEKRWDEGTRLIIADFVLPLACVDEFGNGEEGRLGQRLGEGVEGAERMLASAPLLPNLGKASAHAYWMDLTMQVTFNGQERTLREITSLALSAGWKVVKVTRPASSLFGYLVAIPVPIPVRGRARAGSGSAFLDVGKGSGMGGASLGRMGLGSKLNESMETEMGAGEQEMVEAASSRCGTPTFGSRVDLPSFEDAFARFGGRVGTVRGKGSTGFTGGSRAGGGGDCVTMTNGIGRDGLVEKERQVGLKPSQMPASMVGGPKKKGKPFSPLSVRPPPPSPTYTRQSPIFNRQITPTSPTFNRDQKTPPLPQFIRQPLPSPSTLSSHRQPPSSPLLPARRPPQPLLPALPQPTFHHPPIPRRLSQATLPLQPHGTQRKRAGSVIGFGPSIGGIGMGGLMASRAVGELDIGEEEWRGCEAESSGSVLEAAAKIEQRLPKSTE